MPVSDKKRHMLAQKGGFMSKVFRKAAKALVEEKEHYCCWAIAIYDFKGNAFNKFVDLYEYDSREFRKNVIENKLDSRWWGGWFYQENQLARSLALLFAEEFYK